MQSLSRVHHGVRSLRNWLACWSKHRVTPGAQQLWGRVLLVPILDGVRQRSPIESQVDTVTLPSVDATPKIRRIGLAECLLKIGEGAMIDPIIADVRRHMEPSQLGIGTPDGVVLVVLLLRGPKHQNTG